MIHGIRHFLLQQKSDHWSFNYWSRDSREAKEMPYPDDLDDTFVTLAALYGHDPNLYDGSVLAHIVQLLIAVEVEAGGPYRTWLIGGDISPEWQDVDIVVNSNIQNFLSQIDITLPKLQKYIDDSILAENIRSRYYPGVIQAMYYISRGYRGDQQKKLIEIILSCRNETNTWANPLETAMAISSLVRLGQVEKISWNTIVTLLEVAERDAWQADPLCNDPPRDGTMCFAGSPALTAAFCVEALEKYASALQTRAFAIRPPVVAPSSIALSRIKMMAEARCYTLPESLKRYALRTIEDWHREDVIMVPYVTHHAIRRMKEIPSRLLDDLALANLFGWLAYTAYDHILDDDEDAVSLCAANFFLREITMLYSELERSIPGILTEYIHSMNAIDNANFEEQLGYIKNITDRSIGHALPAIAVLRAVGYTTDSHEIRAMRSWFMHYLAARQLHDNAHDWRDDLRHGRMNSITVKMSALRNNQTILESTLSIYFWREILPAVVSEIKTSLRLARLDFASLASLQHAESFEVLLIQLEDAADRALRERNEAMQFLEAYAG